MKRYGMIYNWISVISLTMLSSCCGYTDKNNNYILDLDTYRWFADRSYPIIFSNDYESYSLTREDITKCEVLIRQDVDELNRAVVKEGFDPYAYEQYGKQYLAAINPKGHVIVYVNCFCDPEHFECKNRDLVVVSDGGHCYFNLLIDLTTNSVIGGQGNGYG
jgi:hypothetical protein